jgi:hypothetical protein
MMMERPSVHFHGTTFLRCQMKLPTIGEVEIGIGNFTIYKGEPWPLVVGLILAAVFFFLAIVVGVRLLSRA